MFKKKKQFSNNELVAIQGICRDIMNKDIKNTTMQDAQYIYKIILVTEEKKAEIVKTIFDEI